MLKRIGAEELGEFKAVASGTLPSGRPVVVNADGTVSDASGSALALANGTPVAYGDANTAHQSITFDSNSNKVVVAFRGTSDYGKAVVGTVNGTDNSISFGTVVTFESASQLNNAITFDSSNNKVVIAYRDEGNSNYGTAIVGTVSGTDISFGSPVVFNTGRSDSISIAFDSSNNKVVIAYRDNGNSNYGTAIVGTVSGTGISFGSEVVFKSATTGVTSAVFDSNSNKVAILYNDGAGKAAVGTVSGTGISFGSEATFESGAVDGLSTAFDSNLNKIVAAYRDEGNSNYGTSAIGTISGTDITFGTPVVFESAGILSTGTAFDTGVNKVNIFYKDGGNSDYGTFVVGTVSGTAISFGTPVVYEEATTSAFAATFDSNSKRVIGVNTDAGNSTKGTAVVVRNAGTYPNLTSENYIGISKGGAVANTKGATVDIIGSVAEVDTEVTTTGFVISSGSYDNKSFSVASQETNPRGVFFKTDGTKMYVVGTAGGAVFQYGLSTAFDVSTASYDNVSLTDFNVVNVSRNGSGLFFHPDGTYVFIVETTNQTNLVRLTLSTPWDLTTAGSKVTNSSLPTNKASNAAQGIFFKPDGSKMYLCENRNAGTDVHGFDLSTNWDISSSSVSSDSSFETTAQDNEIMGLFLNTDGSEFFLIGYQNDKVYRYTISTPYDISTSTFADDFSVGSQENQPEAVTFKPDGTKMYIVGPTNDTVFQYSTSTSVGGPITPGQQYFVQTDGTIGETAGSPSVFAGTAISATELLVKT